MAIFDRHYQNRTGVNQEVLINGGKIVENIRRRFLTTNILNPSLIYQIFAGVGWLLKAKGD